MISEEVDERRRRAVFAWALVLSVLLHALLVPMAFWTTGLKQLMVPQKRPERELVVSSTAIRIEKRSIPRPMTHPNRTAPQPRPPQPPQPEAQPMRPAVPVRQAARPVTRRLEIARVAPTAPPEQMQTPAPRHDVSTLQQQIAQQERVFSQEVAQLRKQDNPLSIATKAPEKPATYQRTYFDVPGHREQQVVQAILIPVRHWFTGSLSCYYTRYVAQFVHGGSEDGVIPWPVCYPANNDQMVHPPWVHDLPIPIPQPGYVLPAGTYLTPLLKSIYNARS